MRPVTPLPRVNPDFLVRPRLLDLLDRWSPMTVLLAPSGAGKAVLAGQWASRARSQGHDVVWLDGEVDRPADVVRALARYARRPLAEDDAATLRMLRRALQDLDRRVAVVVNNAEPILAAIGPELVEIVRDCRDVHLVTVLRRRLDPVAKALLEAETRVIGPSDLQFTTPEVRKLALLHGLDLDPAAAEEARAAVGGWAALIRTGLETLPDGQGRVATTWSPRHVTWFLDVNVAPALPPAAWAAIRRVALVEQPTYGAVLAATGPLEDSARIPLEALGVIDPLVSSGQPLVRLPPLMRDYFRGRYDPVELGPAAEVHRSVAEFWLGRDEPGPALTQAVAGRCWELAVDIVELHWWGLLLHAPEVLRESLQRLPVDEVRGRPIAELLRQLATPDEPPPESAAGRAAIAEIRGWFDGPSPTSSSESVDLLGLLIVRALRRGRVVDAVAWADRGEQVVASLRSASSDPTPLPVRRLARQVGRTRLQLGDTTAASDAFRVVVDGVDVRDALAADAAGHLALCAALHGDRWGIDHWRARWRDLAAPDMSIAGGSVDVAARIAAAADALWSLDADDSTLRGLGGSLTSHGELRPFLVWMETQHALAWGGRSRVRADLEMLRSTLRPRASAWILDLLGSAEAEIWLSLGRPARAQQVLSKVSTNSVFGAVTRARLARMTGRRTEALTLLAPALSAAHPFSPLHIDALALAAWSHHDHDDALARPLLRDAARVALRDRLALPLSRVPREVLQRHADAVPELTEVVTMLDEAGVLRWEGMDSEAPALTPRETAVLRELARGLSLDAVARELFVSRNTIKTQTSAIYRKLGAKDRSEAMRLAAKFGLLD
jgi:LuxR family maltose regulon positive regulatory protein